MSTIISIIGWPFGWLMYWCYKIIPNYAVALFIFTLITRLVLLPLSIKQHKSTIHTQMLAPKMQEIREKYAKNQTKMNEELQKLNEREGINPLAGCVPLLIQMPIILGLFDVIYKPLTYILRMPANVLALARKIAAVVVGAATMTDTNYQAYIINALRTNEGAFAEMARQGYTTFIEQINSLNMSFLGINLIQIPGLKFNNIIIIIPILAAVSSLVLSYVTTQYSKKASGGANPMAGGMGAMMYTMPLVSGWFATTVPAGIGLYWTFSNVLMLAQTIALYKIYDPVVIIAKLKEESAARAVQEREERIEAKKLAKEEGKTEAGQALSRKESDRQKLADARKRLAEKYGDVYNEDKDN